MPRNTSTLARRTGVIDAANIRAALYSTLSASIGSILAARRAGT